MTKETECLLVLSTCPGPITAKMIAQDLVAEKIAACVSIVPGVQSFYAWVGKVDNVNELLLVIKTTVNGYQALEKRLKKLHPHELPEIIAVPILTGSAEYLNWISSNVGKS